MLICYIIYFCVTKRVDIGLDGELEQKKQLTKFVF